MGLSTFTQRRARGFSMIELITALLILALLGALAVPTYRMVIAKSSDDVTRSQLGDMTQNALNIHFQASGGLSLVNALEEAASESSQAWSPSTLAAGPWTVVAAMSAPASAAQQVAWFYSDGLLRTATLSPTGRPCFAQGVFGQSLETWCLDAPVSSVSPGDGGDSPAGVGMDDGPGEPGTFGPSIAVTTSSTTPSGSGGSVSALTVAPANVRAIAGDRRVDLSWSKVAGATGYYVYVDEVKLSSATTSGNEIVLDSLTNGRTYSIKVAAYNDLGAGPLSGAVSATPQVVPQPPVVHYVATPGSETVVVSWSQPALNGTTLAGYLVQVVNLEDGSMTFADLPASTLSTSLTIPYGLPTQVRVRAKIAAAASAPGVANITTRQAPPASPLSLAATPANGSVLLDWGLPSSTYDAPVTGFRVYVDGEAAPRINVDAPTVSTLIGALTNGVSYSFAVSSFGPGGESARVTVSAVPITLPSSAPVASGGATTPSTVEVTWTSVPSSAASPVAGYRVYVDGSLVPAAFASPAATSATLTGLAPGVTYSLVVAAYNSLGDGPLSNSVALTTIGPPEGSPAPVVVGNVTGSTVSVSWSAVTGTPLRPLSGYRLYRNGALYALRPAGSTSHVFTGLTAGTQYTFAVAAYGIGGQGALSNIVSATPVNPPARPNGTLAVTTGDGGVYLSWDAVESTAPAPVYGYHVYVDGAATPALTVPGAESSSVFVPDLTNGVTYSFSLAAFGPLGDGDVLTASGTPYAPPAAVFNPATAVGDGELVAQWSPVTSSSAAPVYGYLIYVGGTSTVVKALSASASTTTLTGLTNGTPYWFQIVAYGPGGFSSRADLTGTPFARPPAPSSLTGSALAGQVSLSWSAVPSTTGAPVASYRVYMDGMYLKSVPFGTTATSVTGLTNGVAYVFTVTALGAGGEGAASPSKTLTPITSPSTPSNFAGTVTANSVTLTWSAVPSSPAAPVSGYYVYKNGSTSPFATTASTSVTDNAVTTGGTYTYQVAAYGPGGIGAVSTPITMTPSLPPIGPSGLTATSGNGQATLSWPAVPSYSGEVAWGYYIYLNGSTTPSATVPSRTTTSYVYGSLTNGVAYTFTIASYGPGGVSAATAPASVTPYAPPPAVSDASAAPADSAASVSWTPAVSTTGAPVSGYYLYVNGSATPSATVNGVASSSFSYGSLTNGVTYSFQVASFGPGGVSARSAAVSVTPLAPPRAPTVTATGGVSSVSVSWVAGDNGGSPLTGMEVEIVGVTPSASAVVIPLSASATSYVFGGLSAGHSFTVRVRGVSAVGGGVWSAASPSVFVAPSAPTGLSVSAVSESAVSASWTNPTYGAAWVETSLSSAAGVNRGSVSAYTFTSLAANTSYTVAVRACNNGGCSAYTSPLSVQTAPAPPSGLTFAASTSSQANFAWSASAGASRYEFSVNNGATVSTTVTSASASLAAGSTATVKVRACNSSLCSSFTSNVTIGTAPDAVLGTIYVGLSGYSTSDWMANWSWSWAASPGATYYKLAETWSYGNYAGGSIGGYNVEHIHTVSSSSIGYGDHARLAAGAPSPYWSYYTRYNFLRACNAYGCSAQTANWPGFTVRTWTGVYTLDYTSSTLYYNGTSVGI